MAQERRRRAVCRRRYRPADAGNAAALRRLYKKRRIRLETENNEEETHVDNQDRPAWNTAEDAA